MYNIIKIEVSKCCAHEKPNDNQELQHTKIYTKGWNLKNMEYADALSAFWGKNLQSASPARFLWAKSHPHKQLLAHMIDVGNCVKEYLSASSSRAVLQFLSSQWNCSSNTAVSFAAYLASLHDIGKATPQFQRKDNAQFRRLQDTEIRYCFPPQSPNDDIRHEISSKQIAQRIWSQQDSTLKKEYAFVLALHHQRKSKIIKNNMANCWNAMQEDLEKAARQLFHAPDELLKPAHIDAVCTLLTGLIILCDWVASSSPFDVLAEVNETYDSDSTRIAKKTLRDYGLIEDRTFPKIDYFQSVWPKITQPRSIQMCCERLNPDASLTIIEAPMGEGKTEAALFLAARLCSTWKKRGIYVALPTQATSNQIYYRFMAMLDQIHAGSAKLLHGTAFLYEPEQNGHSEDPNKAGNWLRPLRMGLLAENGVGTVDQAMASVLMAKFSVLRLLGLANKILIIDEIHAYDAYMSEIIRSLLSWCKALQIPVILLSATLQDSQREDYLSCFANRQMNRMNLSGSYPLITQATCDGTIKQIECNASIRTRYSFETVRIGTDFHLIAQYAMRMVKNGGCYCVLMNTVEHAQEVYRIIKDLRDSETEILLYHARFPLGKRLNIEKKCLSMFGKDAQRPQKAILVATQVVEQSLDIDFDGMLTELAPIDLLLQRAGRVHRHKERNRPAVFFQPVITVILPDASANRKPEERYGLSGGIYAPFLLNNTEEIVKEGLSICVPEDVRDVIAKVYDHITKENKLSWESMDFRQQKMQAAADGISFPSPDKETFFMRELLEHLFDQPDVDDGFETKLHEPDVDDDSETKSHATTRLGDSTVRISFCSSDFVSSVRTDCLSKEQEQTILYASVSIVIHFSENDLKTSGLVPVKKGHLKGCYLSPGYDSIQIGRYAIRNDAELGIIKEK